MEYSLQTLREHPQGIERKDEASGKRFIVMPFNEAEYFRLDVYGTMFDRENQPQYGVMVSVQSTNHLQLLLHLMKVENWKLFEATQGWEPLTEKPPLVEPIRAADTYIQFLCEEIYKLERKLIQASGFAGWIQNTRIRKQKGVALYTCGECHAQSVTKFGIQHNEGCIVGKALAFTTTLFDRSDTPEEDK